MPVLLLKEPHKGGRYYVCDEYYPSDDGRVHILGDSMYARFLSDVYTLEIRKVAIEVVAIFQGESWPEEIENVRDRQKIIEYFEQRIG